MIRTTSTLIALAALTACATPNPPSVTAADVDRSFADARALSLAPFTDTIDLPRNEATYRGAIGADVSGDINGSIQGEMTMNVYFDDGDIDGAVRNINLIDQDGRPNQRLDGHLDIQGFEDNGRLDAFASGDLEAVDNGGFIVDTNVLLQLDGDVVDDRGLGDGVFGSARGNGVGDINFDVDGVFYGVSD
jgi:hypothetical protein